jgi:hypothetical protein
MRSGVGARMFEIRPDPTAAGARRLPGSMAQHLCENLGPRRKCSLFRQLVFAPSCGCEHWTKGGLGCLFLILSDCCLKLPRRPRLYKFGGTAASDSFLQPDREITRHKRGKRIQHNVHRIGVAGEIEEIE